MPTSKSKEEGYSYISFLYFLSNNLLQSREAATVLSNLRDCPRQSLEALASLAVSPAAFDEPSTWHSSQVNSVGCVLNGMSRDDITTIPAEGFESLVPDVIECLTKDTLRVNWTCFSPLMCRTSCVSKSAVNDQNSKLAAIF